MKKLTILIAVAAFVVAGAAFAAGGFNEYGYNYDARIFNGTGGSWSLANGSPADSMGVYANDKLVMKWTSEWDRGNAENWSDGPYPDAWTSNEWNGKGKGGSGEVWHYKIIWVGSELENSPYWREGGYSVWGQFEVVMDQGTTADHEHVWLTHATPNGYGQ